MHSKSEKLKTGYNRLTDILKEMNKILVAFSGGVDSTFLLNTAVEVKGRANVLAVTALSETTPDMEKESSALLSEQIGVEHLCIESGEMSDPEFTGNPENKCYICKKIRFSELVRIAAERGYSHVIEGTNTDDRNDYRPGIIAVRELGIRSPLEEAELNKDSIRMLSKDKGLSTWDMPSFACLASRIPCNTPITAEKLRMVDKGESFIRNHGISRQVRVRHYGDTARIEVEENAILKLMEDSNRKRVAEYLKSIGFKFITVDLEGYRTGSLNTGKT